MSVSYCYACANCGEWIVWNAALSRWEHDPSTDPERTCPVPRRGKLLVWAANEQGRKQP